MALTDLTTSVASGATIEQPKNESAVVKKQNDKTRVKKSSTNRSITCSEELRDRLRKMSRDTDVPIQRLVERFLCAALEHAGY